MIKNPPVDAGNTCLIPGTGSSPGEGNGNPQVFLPGESHGQRSLVAIGDGVAKYLDKT